MRRDTATTSILRTLLYAQVFSAGVRRDELKQLLLSPQGFSETQLNHACKRMISQRKIFQREAWLTGARGISLTQLRSRRNESERKLGLVQELIRSISWLPSIKGIVLTGSVAVGNATKGEDIDLMIVTRSGFLWSTRAVVNAIFATKGVLRRRGEKETANKLCLNLWLDEDSLVLQAKTLYVARELIQAKWLINRANIRERMMAANSWAGKFLHSRRLRSETNQYLGSRFVEKLFAPIEYCIFWLQLFHMYSRTREIVTPHKAFFHPRDTQAFVLGKYQALCRKRGIDSLVDN